MIKLNSDARRTLKKPWLWVAIILGAAFVWVFAFYWASQTPTTYTFRVWVGAEAELNEELTSKIEAACKDGGMKKCEINSYSPDDFYYPAAFSLQSHYVDIYIIDKEAALTIAETGIFSDISGEYGQNENALKYNEQTIGVKFKEEYYALINSTSKKDAKLLFAVFDVIVGYGETA